MAPFCLSFTQLCQKGIYSFPLKIFKETYCYCFKEPCQWVCILLYDPFYYRCRKVTANILCKNKVNCIQQIHCIKYNMEFYLNLLISTIFWQKHVIKESRFILLSHIVGNVGWASNHAASIKAYATYIKVKGKTATGNKKDIQRPNNRHTLMHKLINFILIYLICSSFKVGKLR